MTSSVYPPPALQGFSHRVGGNGAGAEAQARRRELSYGPQRRLAAPVASSPAEFEPRATESVAAPRHPTHHEAPAPQTLQPLLLKVLHRMRPCHLHHRILHLLELQRRKHLPPHPHLLNLLDQLCLPLRARLCLRTSRISISRTIEWLHGKIPGGQRSCKMLQGNSKMELSRL